MVPLLQELWLLVLSVVFWREVDENDEWQMLVNYHAAVVQADVAAALVEVHTNWFLQNNGSNYMADQLLDHLHLLINLRDAEHWLSM
jgi:hypothetical protein